MTDALEGDLCKMLDWFEENNSLWAVVLTGTVSTYSSPLSSYKLLYAVSAPILTPLLGV
jgi:hypothetical protein